MTAEGNMPAQLNAELKEALSKMGYYVIPKNKARVFKASAAISHMAMRHMIGAPRFLAETKQQLTAASVRQMIEDGFQVTEREEPSLNAKLYEFKFFAFQVEDNE
jgi:hypothetical protein